MATLDKEMMDIEKLKCLLEETEIVKTHMELILMNPHMDPAIRKKYAEAIPIHNNRIKDLRRRIAFYRNAEKSAKTEKIETPVQGTELNTRCAWCDRENGRKAQPNESHGICRMHSEQFKTEAIRLHNIMADSSDLNTAIEAIQRGMQGGDIPTTLKSIDTPLANKKDPTL